MKNNFQQLEDAQMRDFNFNHNELEARLLKQADTFSFFGKVTELFTADALKTVVKIIGGDAPNQADGSNQRQSPSSPAWRNAPNSSPNVGGSDGRGW
jgi:hypothetical protein